MPFRKHAGHVVVADRRMCVTEQLLMRQGPGGDGHKGTESVGGKI